MFNKENKSLRQRVAKLEELVQSHQETLHGDGWGINKGLVRETASISKQSETNTKRTKSLMVHLKVVEILHGAKPPTLQIVSAQSLIVKKAAKAKKK